MPDKLRSGGRNRTLRQLVLLIYAAMPAAAAYADGIKWDFDGFGTLAGIKTDEDIARYRLDLRQGDGATSDDIDWGLQSKLGAQLTVDFGEQFSVTAQAVAQRRGQDDMDPELEWLYASYRPASWFDIRAGRLVMPELMMSDYRSVGYAQPTVTPPALVYIWASVSQFEGAQIYNRIPLGKGLLTLQTSAGEADEDFWVATSPQVFGPDTFPPTLNLKLEKLRAFNVIYEWDDWLLRGVRIEQELTLSSSASPPFPALDQTFKGFGVQYDNGQLLVMAESIDRSDVATAQYILLGWRFDRWLPSVTFSQSEVIDGFAQTKRNYDSKTFALRYDITQNMAIKLQWEEVPYEYTNTFTQWLDVYPGSGGDREVISFGLDFVF